MAAVLEVHLMLRKCPELWTIQRLIRGYGITTRALVSMDSWQFDNPQPVEMPGPLTELLARHPILVAECAAAAFRAAGWHLERAGAEAIFTAWVDTFGHPQLDRDRITAENRSCYAAIYRSIALLARGAPGMFLAAGIGVETVFDYQGDLDRAIESAQNMTAWILGLGGAAPPDGFAVRRSGADGLCIYEKTL